MGRRRRGLRARRLRAAPVRPRASTGALVDFEGAGGRLVRHLRPLGRPVRRRQRAAGLDPRAQRGPPVGGAAPDATARRCCAATPPTPMRTIENGTVPYLMEDEHRYRRSLREIQLYLEQTPDALVVPGHDMAALDDAAELPTLGPGEAVGVAGAAGRRVDQRAADLRNADFCSRRLASLRGRAVRVVAVRAAGRCRWAARRRAVRSSPPSRSGPVSQYDDRRAVEAGTRRRAGCRTGRRRRASGPGRGPAGRRARRSCAPRPRPSRWPPGGRRTPACSSTWCGGVFGQRVVGHVVGVAVGLAAVPEQLDQRQDQRPLELVRVVLVEAERAVCTPSKLPLA